MIQKRYFKLRLKLEKGVFLAIFFISDPFRAYGSVFKATFKDTGYTIAAKKLTFEGFNVTVILFNTLRCTSSS